VHLREVVAKRHLALALQRQAQRVGTDVGVAVAIAAHPVPHAQEGRHRATVQRQLEFAVEHRDLREEGDRIPAQRVFDLVGHRQPGGAQHARLPQLGDAGADGLLVGPPLGAAVQPVARGDEAGDRALGVEDALALHLGRMRGQHRADVGLLQRLGDRLGVVAGLAQLLQAARQRPLLAVAQALVVQAAAHVVAVLGEVGQVREVAEGADHAHRLVARQALQQAVEFAPGLVVALEAVGHRQLAHALH